MITALEHEGSGLPDTTTSPAISRATGVARWAVMLFVASIPYADGIAIAGLGSVSRMLGLSALGLTLWATVSKNGVRLRAPSVFIVGSGAFVTWLLASYFWSAFPMVTLSNVFTMIQLLALVWLVHETSRGTTELASLMQAFVVGVYLLIGTTVFRVLTSTDLGFRDLGGFNPNGFAIVASLALPMAWFLQARDAQPDALRRRPLPLRLLNAFYPVAALSALVLAASRGGLLVMLTCLIIIPLTLNRLAWWRRVVLALALAGATTALALLAPTVFPELQASIERLSGVTDELTTGTLTGRTTIWAQGLEFVKDSPVIGSGAGTFAYLHQAATGEFRSAHNAFLAVAVGSGSIGLLLFVILIAASAVAAMRSSPEVRPYLLVLLAALVVSMLPANTDNDKFMWLVLALVGSQAPTFIVADSKPRPAGR